MTGACSHALTAARSLWFLVQGGEAAAAVLEPWHTLFNPGHDSAVPDEEGAGILAVAQGAASCDFLLAPPVLGEGDDRVVGFLLWWRGEATLRRF